MSKVFNWRTALMATSVLVMVAPASSWAAEQGDNSTLQEVVVTARKREERLQDVPLAVTALTGQSLARENIVQVADLATRSPSLMVSPGFVSASITAPFA